MHVPVHDIEDIREDWTLPSSLKLTVTLRSSKVSHQLTESIILFFLWTSHLGLFSNTTQIDVG